MTTLTERVETAVAQIEQARDQIALERDKWRQYTQVLHNIVHGPESGADSLVLTASGEVKTVARVLKQALDEMQQARAAYEAETGILHAIVNGPASGPDSLVTTGSGDVPTVARQIEDLKTQVLAGTLEALGAAPLDHSHDSLDAGAL